MKNNIIYVVFLGFLFSLIQGMDVVKVKTGLGDYFEYKKFYLPDFLENDVTLGNIVIVDGKLRLNKKILGYRKGCDSYFFRYMDKSSSYEDGFTLHFKVVNPDYCNFYLSQVAKTSKDLDESEVKIGGNDYFMYGDYFVPLCLRNDLYLGNIYYETDKDSNLLFKLQEKLTQTCDCESFFIRGMDRKKDMTVSSVTSQIVQFEVLNPEYWNSYLNKVIILQRCSK